MVQRGQYAAISAAGASPVRRDARWEHRTRLRIQRSVGHGSATRTRRRDDAYSQLGQRGGTERRARACRQRRIRNRASRVDADRSASRRMGRKRYRARRHDTPYRSVTAYLVPSADWPPIQGSRRVRHIARWSRAIHRLAIAAAVVVRMGQHGRPVGVVHGRVGADDRLRRASLRLPWRSGSRIDRTPLRRTHAAARIVDARRAVSAGSPAFARCSCRVRVLGVGVQSSGHRTDTIFRHQGTGTSRRGVGSRTDHRSRGDRIERYCAAG